MANGNVFDEENWGSTDNEVKELYINEECTHCRYTVYYVNQNVRNFVKGGWIVVDILRLY